MDFRELLPQNYPSVLSGFLVILGIIGLFYSLFAKNNRILSLKIPGILLLISLAIMADSFWVYFAVVFIIATIVTELNFLETLAAIIRGSKEYFQYKYQTSSQLKASLQNEIISDQAASGSETETQNMNQLVNEYYDIEKKTFDYLEKEYKTPILRHVLFGPSKNRFMFDGIMKLQNLDVLFEIKYIKRKAFILPVVMRKTNDIISTAVAYKNAVKREVILRIIVVSQITSNDWSLISAKLYSALLTDEIQVEYSCIHPEVLEDAKFERIHKTRHLDS